MNKWDKFVSDHREEAMRQLCAKYSQLRVEDIENIFQDSLLVMHNSIESNKIAEPLYAYLMKICHNLSKKMVNKQGHHLVVGINSDDIMVSHTVSQRSVEEILRVCEENDRKERESTERKKKLVRAILKEMSEKCKHLLLRHYVEGFNWETVAQMSNIPNGDTAKVTARRCRMAFQKKYNQLKNRIYG